MSKKWKLKNIISTCLLVLFCWHLAGTSMFNHTHIVDGVVVCHSHPFSGTRDNPGHSHTATQFDTLAQLALLIFILGAGIGVSGIFPTLKFNGSVPQALSAYNGYRGAFHLRGPPTN